MQNAIKDKEDKKLTDKLKQETNDYEIVRELLKKKPETKRQIKILSKLPNDRFLNAWEMLVEELIQTKIKKGNCTYDAWSISGGSVDFSQVLYPPIPVR